MPRRTTRFQPNARDHLQPSPARQCPHRTARKISLTILLRGSGERHPMPIRLSNRRAGRRSWPCQAPDYFEGPETSMAGATQLRFSNLFDFWRIRSAGTSRRASGFSQTRTATKIGNSAPMKAVHESLQDMDQYIVLATKRIEEQRNRVLELRRRGEDDTSSQRLLAALIHSLTICEQRREHLIELLAAQSGERARK
jgi:hypothetical protein